ncbi:MAG TPA: response regulator transcription factor [Arcobacter sp.]|nr:response regulator transcription factor [Arcobacter sp.]
MENLKKYNIIYAEDETIIRLNVTHILEQYFKQVIVVTNGEEALKAYRSEKADVLMLDISMPIKTGLEVAKIVREENEEIPIILLTALSDRETLLNAVELNLVKYLLKPMQDEAFMITLQKVSKILQNRDSNTFWLTSDYCWNRSIHTLFYKKEEIYLTHKERSLLELLINSYNQTVSYEDIMVHVWIDEFEREITIDSVKKLVSSLRKKIPQNSLRNIYGRGYLLK